MTLAKKVLIALVPLVLIVVGIWAWKQWPIRPPGYIPTVGVATMPQGGPSWSAPTTITWTVEGACTVADSVYVRAYTDSNCSTPVAGTNSHGVAVKPGAGDVTPLIDIPQGTIGRVYFRAETDSGNKSAVAFIDFK